MSVAGMIVIGGLPGTGKSSIAKPLARRLQAPFLRVDTIEQGLVDSGELPGPPGVAGYSVAGRLAVDQIRVGLTVVVECVNPLKISRDAWRDVAERSGAWILEVETTCSDSESHRLRIENREVDVAGLVLPSWEQVLEGEYEPRDHEHLVLDTAVLSVDSSVEAIVRQIGAASGSPRRWIGSLSP